MIKKYSIGEIQDEALRDPSLLLVVVAVPREYYSTLPLPLLEGKTVVDVSNRNSVKRKEELSQAEVLQGMAEGAR